MYKTLSPLISRKQNADALALSSRFSDLILRKRAYVDFLGVFYAADYLQEAGFRANISRSVFKSAKLYSDFEVLDIYSNAHRLNVITAYGSDIVKIPAAHKKFDIFPEGYIVVEIKAGAKEAAVKGIILPEDISDNNFDGSFYKFNINKLRNVEELFQIIKSYAGIKPSIGRHLDCMNMFVSYTDGKLSDDDKKKLIQHILSCETCKKRLMDTLEFDAKSKNIMNHNGILSNDDFSSEENFIRNIHNTGNNQAGLKGAIDVIYNADGLNGLKKESFKYKADFPIKANKLILTAFTVVAVLLVAVSFAFNVPYKKTAENKTVQGEIFSDGDTNAIAFESSVPDFEVNIPKINKTKGYTTISKVSWEVSGKVNSEEQKNFLQQAGKSIRLNLQNDLVLSSEVAVNNKAKFDIGFYRDGNLENVTLAQSSGSGAVDKLIGQSIESSLHYMRPPKGSFVGKKNALTLVVDF